MTDPTPSRMLSYASDDGSQLETVRVAISGRALRATGYIVATGSERYGASYSVIVDAGGHTRRVAVHCDDVAGERSLSLTRSPDGPWIAEDATGAAPQPALDDALDVFLVGSAFCASLPVRRLGLHAGAAGREQVTAASIVLPALSVAPVRIGYTAAAAPTGVRVRSEGAFGERDLAVDDDGLLIAAAGMMARID